MLSPDLDSHIHTAQRSQDFCGSHAGLVERVRQCREKLAHMTATMDANDRIWSLWLRTPRGSSGDFGDYESYLADGEVSSREEFEELWLLEYPEPIQWWRLSIVHYADQLWFFLAGKLQFGVDLVRGVFTAIDPTDEMTQSFLRWLLESIGREVDQLLEDPLAYNKEIDRGLPLHLRYGRLKRRDLWRQCGRGTGESHPFASVDVTGFSKLVADLDETRIIPQMSVSSFLEYCRTCYLAIGYEAIDPTLPAREMYRRMADGRDDGLLDLPLDDAEAFRQWCGRGSLGGHPFEICRGGSRTHISLYPTKREQGWQLTLMGFSRARVEETAKMALALFRAGAPLCLPHKEEMLRMITGADFIGIVPRDCGLGYNQADFPREDRIYDFAHLWTLEDLCGGMPEGVCWYPLKEATVASPTGP